MSNTTENNPFPYTDALLESDPFNLSKENQELFVKSFQEMAIRHYQNNKMFRAFCDGDNIDPFDIQKESDLHNIPYILVNLFKEKELRSCKENEIELILTSSGTGGQKSQQVLDKNSLDNVKKLAFNIHKALGMTSKEKCNYLCFTYDPQVADDLGTAFTDELLTNFTERNEVYYAIQWDEDSSSFKLNTQGVIEKLEEYNQQNYPVRILGFPAFLYQILQDHELNFNFGEKSWVQTGGGWKNHANKEISKTEFRAFISKRLGIPQGNIRDMFGMVEHGVPYVDCEKGRLHIPNYSRVYIRDPHTLKILPMGQKGLIHFLCSYNSSYPCISVLTTDYGSIENCDCHLGGATLKIVGRAGISKHKGCAIKAAEMLKESR